jgi:hypothetical protein
VIFLESSLKDVSCAPYPSLCLYNVVLDDNIRTPYTCKKIRYIAFETKTGKKKRKRTTFLVDIYGWDKLFKQKTGADHSFYIKLSHFKLNCSFLYGTSYFYNCILEDLRSFSVLIAKS